MNVTAVVFSATGTVQTYVVPSTGIYVIEAAGGQGGAGAGRENKGARVRGMFNLRQGDRLKIVAGRRGMAGNPPYSVASRGGDSLVWAGSTDLPQPVKLMLCARGGKGGDAGKTHPAGAAADSGGGKDDGPAAEGFNPNSAEIDPVTVDTLATQWTSVTGSATTHTTRSAGQTDRAGYNAGAFRTSTLEVQADDGYVSITPVTSNPKENQPPRGSTPANAAAPGLVPAGAPAGAGGNGSAGTSLSPASPDDPGSEPPSQTMLPHVTPRPESWKKLLLQRRRRETE